MFTSLLILFPGRNPSGIPRAIPTPVRGANHPSHPVLHHDPDAPTKSSTAGSPAASATAATARRPAAAASPSPVCARRSAGRLQGEDQPKEDAAIVWNRGGQPPVSPKKAQFFSRRMVCMASSSIFIWLDGQTCTLQMLTVVCVSESK